MHTLQLKIAFTGHLQQAIKPELNYLFDYLVKHYEIPLLEWQKAWEYLGKPHV